MINGEKSVTDTIIKYPRTPHIEGSRLGEGDFDLERIAFSALAGEILTVEEKVDGANTAISFGADGELLLQSRGHYMRGGGREEQFSLFKIWASTHRASLYSMLGKRYIMYGEWLYAKHAVYYDALPHYFMEFDIFDKETGRFLDTLKRQSILRGSPVVSVPLLKQGKFSSLKELTDLITESPYISEKYLESFDKECISLGLDPISERALLPDSRLMEGIYIKIEAEGEVKDRMKFVRKGFRQIQLASDNTGYKPIIKNSLSPSAKDIFAL